MQWSSESVHHVLEQKYQVISDAELRVHHQIPIPRIGHAGEKKIETSDKILSIVASDSGERNLWMHFNAVDKEVMAP